MPSTRLHGCAALFLTFLFALATAQGAAADRTLYFADPAADAVAQFDVGAGGALTPLHPATVAAPDARRHFAANHDSNRRA